jgi:very-short-patch-repair endonuclease
MAKVRPPTGTTKRLGRTVGQAIAKATKKPAGPSAGEQLFLAGWQEFGTEHWADQPAREFHFYRTRDWRFDFAWPECNIAVEIEGATFSNGRHSRGAGFRDDCIKYNAAAANGWLVFRFTSEMLKRDLRACVEQVARRVLHSPGIDPD